MLAALPGGIAAAAERDAVEPEEVEVHLDRQANCRSGSSLSRNAVPWPHWKAVKAGRPPWASAAGVQTCDDRNLELMRAP